MEWGARVKAGCMAILTLFGYGCAAPAGQWETLPPRREIYQPSVFAHRMVSQDVEMFWSCSRPQPSLIRVDGIAKNIGSGEVHLLGMELHDVDRLTERMLQSAEGVSDLILHPDLFSPFEMELQPASANGWVDLLYTYRIISSGSIKTTTTDKQLLTHDMCTATQHANTVTSP
jgi:hypothetical protein